MNRFKRLFNVSLFRQLCIDFDLVGSDLGADCTRDVESLMFRTTDLVECRNVARVFEVVCGIKSSLSALEDEKLFRTASRPIGEGFLHRLRQ